MSSLSCLFTRQSEIKRGFQMRIWIRQPGLEKCGCIPHPESRKWMDAGGFMDKDMAAGGLALWSCCSSEMGGHHYAGCVWGCMCILIYLDHVLRSHECKSGDWCSHILSLYCCWCKYTKFATSSHLNYPH